MHVRYGEGRPFFSIISVSKDCREYVEKTMASVQEQVFHDYEYIIVDGNSQDGTAELERRMLERSDNTKMICEADKGIYDAMNKGIGISQGRYLIFLNMGDEFYDGRVLQRCHDWIVKNEGYQLFYGDIYSGGSFVKYSSRISRFWFLREKTVCHQAIAADKRCFEQNLFDISYKICADRKWLYQCYAAGIGMQHMHICVAKYDETGVSQNRDRFLEESWNLVKEEFGMPGVLFVILKRKLGNWCRDHGRQVKAGRFRKERDISRLKEDGE